MKKVLFLFILIMGVISCSEETEEIKQLSITGSGKFSETGKYQQTGYELTGYEFNYSVYVHKGENVITDELLNNPSKNAVYKSENIFLYLIKTCFNENQRFNRSKI